MSLIQQIMTPNPFFLSQHANVNKARMLMANQKIRHVPIKDADTGKLIGMLNQKEVLANAIKIISKRGLDQLEHTEKSIDIASLMDNKPMVVDISADLLEVANGLLKQKSGCVAIIDKEELVGVITSNDFVKLAIQQLSQDSV
jgi:CBS domain-containing membrane protein